MKILSFLILILSGLFVSASIPVFAQISRTQIINNAIPYTTATWTATSANIWNSVSCGGKTIRTPSWVKVGTNTGMPYCWGGWTTTGNMQGYLNAGKSAGDNNTTADFGAEPQCAVGLDCSGFVSRAWGLSSKYSTSTLPDVSTPTNITQTQPGDIFNLASSHVRLVNANYGNGNYQVIESSAKDWKVSYTTYTASQLSSYTPRVYNNLAGAFTLTVTQGCNGYSNRLILDWTKSSGAATYDIYKNGSLYNSGITGLQFIDSINLTPGTGYSYFVQAKSTYIINSNAQSAIAPNCASSVTITSPNGGEIWQAGTSHLITWTSLGISDSIPLQIVLYKNGTAQTTITSAVPNTGKYSWSIPLNFTLGSNYRIYINGMSGTVSDFSDSNFAIAIYPPVVSTAAVSNITNTTVAAGGNVTSDGGAYVNYRGLCWSTGNYPTTIDSFSIDGEGTGTFSSNITGLIPGTIYHYRAYSINFAGTGYGEILTFTTNLTGINETKNIPTEYTLNQNYPNPFNPTTIITYAVPVESHVRINVYNTLGSKVKVLEDNIISAGWHNVVFSGNRLSSGIYLCTIEAAALNGMRTYRNTIKLVMVK